MELRQLESLVAIADGGSFSRATITLNLAQPSLSRQMALLEVDLGQRLLVRTGRGVELTSLSNCRLVLPNAPNAIRGLLDDILGPRGVVLNVLAEVGAVQTVLALVAEGDGSTVLPESALATRPGADRLPHAPLGPPAIRNTLVLATPLARPGTRLACETAQLLRSLDFRTGFPSAP